MADHSAAKLWPEVVGLSSARGRLVAFSALAAVLGLLGPRRLEGGPGLCLYRQLTGRPCPACGMTRAMAALTRGHLRTATHYNRLSVPLGLILLLIGWRDIYQLLNRKTRKLPEIITTF
jgi:hypothetical protein